MRTIAERLNEYVKTLDIDLGNDENETVLDKLFQAYAESHESDPAEIGGVFKELEDFLRALPLDDNNAVFALCCRLCTAHERKAFLDGVQYGAHRMRELGIQGG